MSDQKTLRDEFAMAALTGLLSCGYGGFRDGITDETAQVAYILADAMLKARNPGRE